MSVLSPSHSAGPHGLGDPNDKSLRRVEIEVLIPKKMRDIARVEKCFEEVEKFSQCCKDNSLLMVFSCRNENSALKGCLTRWYQDDGFKERCKNEYLQERSLYRSTGIPSKKHSRIANHM